MKIEIDIDPRIYGDYLQLCEIGYKENGPPEPNFYYSIGPIGGLSAILELELLETIQKAKAQIPGFHSLETTPPFEAEKMAIGRAAAWEERVKRGCDG